MNQPSLARRRAITAGLLLGMSLGALEATVVGTAMPTVIATLGGLAHYSWVFAAYLLTSTASVPIWGRLSDLYGRRRLYLAGIVVFIAGSALSGAATTMTQLIVFRAIQGLGAGAVIPLSMTIVGELYTLEERARAQALFSGVWGLASIAGPLVGGYVTDALSWRWVFYLNLPFGVLAAVVIALAYPATARTDGRADGLAGRGAALRRRHGAADRAGRRDRRGRALARRGGGAARDLRARRAPHGRSDSAARSVPPSASSPARSLVVFMTGMAMFGAIAFVPLFVQGVMGGTATQAGQVLTPLFLGWVGTSVVGARLTVRIGYRPVAVAGSALLTAGFVALAMIDADTHDDGAARGGVRARLRDGVVDARRCCWRCSTASSARSSGLATSLNQFSRSVGAAVGVAAMGAILARGLVGSGPPGRRARPAVGGASARRRARARSSRTR